MNGNIDQFAADGSISLRTAHETAAMAKEAVMNDAVP
jgi:hypothetical protein